MRRYLIFFLVIVAAVGVAFAVRSMRNSQSPSSPETAIASDANSITVTEGTNFSVAASPDGRTLVIDLLGSLWALPGQGGGATKITEELIEARHASFSPDGTHVVFQGFKDNDGWDLWTIKPDGSEAKRITSGPYYDMEPQWSHDGTRIAFSSDRSRNFAVWILDVKSGGVKRVTQSTSQDSQPAWSPDDKEIAFVRQSTAPPGTPPAGSAAVVAINVETGAEREIASVQGRVSGPSWAGDGKQIMYNVIADGTGRIELSGKPVASGEDVFPFRAQWLSASDFLYTADGKIKRRTLGVDKAGTIPFSAILPVKPAKYARKKFDFNSDQPRKAQGIVRPVISPDGKRVAFAALGDVWVMEIGQKPTRVTHDQYIDTDPAWSPDGTQLVFSSDRAEMGNLDLWVRNMKTGTLKRVTKTPYPDFGANWSPDGKRIAFVSMLPHQKGAAIAVVDVQSGQMKELWRAPVRIPSYPTWSPDGKMLLVAAFDQYSPRFREGIWKPLLIPVDGGEPQWVDITPDRSLVSGVDEGPVWSPDGRKLALIHQGLLKVVAVEGGRLTSQFTQLSTDAAQAPSWTGDSKHVLYLATDQLKMVSVDDRKVTDVPMELTYQSAIPKGTYVIHAGHVWNGRDNVEQSEVDIVIENNRIKSVGGHNAELHKGVKVIDASEGTVIPGLMDLHDHVYREYGEAAGRLLLAYGITAARDPAGMGYRCLELKEASEAGVRMGPRFYPSYPAFDGARVAFAEMYSVLSMDRLELELQRAKKLDYDLFKMYVTLPLAMQKRIIEFAHNEIGIPVTSHFIYPDATWGADGTEHVGGRASALGNLYSDQMQLLLKSGIELCPTMAVSGGYDVLGVDDPTYITDQRLKVLCPEWALEPSRERIAQLRKSGSAIRAKALMSQGKSVMALVRAGIPVLAGTDAPNMPYGVGLHAELELFVRSGMTPVEALKTATIYGAEALGFGADLGTIEPGKIADIVILDADPLADIKNTRKVNTVIKNGRVFTMKQLMAVQKGGGLAAGGTEQ